jgi:cytidine deaminase
MATPETVLIGDRVCYESAADTICGEVVKIMRAPNAAGELIDWIYVEYYNEQSPCKHSIARLAETSLEMMKFVVTFRDHTHKESVAA